MVHTLSMMAQKLLDTSIMEFVTSMARKFIQMDAFISENLGMTSKTAKAFSFGAKEKSKESGKMHNSFKS